MPRSIEEFYQNYDAALKKSLTIFKGKTLAFLGLTNLPPIGDALSENIVEVDVQYSDLTFALSTGEGLHIEYEASISKEDLLRFCTYHTKLSLKHNREFHTVILTHNDDVCKIDTDNLRFTPHVICLQERDADETLNRIRRQIANGEPVNELELVYLPLYKSQTWTVRKLLEEGAAMTRQLSISAERQSLLLSLMLLVSNKLVDEKDLYRIWKEFSKMVKLKIIEFAEKKGMEEGRQEGMEKGIEQGMEQGLEQGRQEGIEEGMAKGRQEGIYSIARKLLSKNNDINSVMDITGLSQDEIDELQSSM